MAGLDWNRSNEVLTRKALNPTRCNPTGSNTRGSVSEAIDQPFCTASSISHSSFNRPQAFGFEIYFPTEKAINIEGPWLRHQEQMSSKRKAKPAKIATGCHGRKSAATINSASTRPHLPAGLPVSSRLKRHRFRHRTPSLPETEISPESLNFNSRSVRN